jgi:hypothetical protein
MSDKPVATTLPGTVQKIIHSPDPSIPEKAEIAVEGADELYKEIRIENTLTDDKGNVVKLKPGAEVEVTVEAPPEAVVPKNGAQSKNGNGHSSVNHHDAQNHKAKGTGKG